MDFYQTILVAIPCSENLEFNENFAGVAMRTTIREISGKILSFSQLLQTNMRAVNSLLRSAVTFLRLKVESRLKETLSNGGIDTPRMAYDHGNKKGGSPPLPCYRRTILLTWKWILEAGIDATWSGPEGSTHDVETSKKSFEVKSTI